MLRYKNLLKLKGVSMIAIYGTKLCGIDWRGLDVIWVFVGKEGREGRIFKRLH